MAGGQDGHVGGTGVEGGGQVEHVVRLDAEGGRQPGAVAAVVAGRGGDVHSPGPAGANR